MKKHYYINANICRTFEYKGSDLLGDRNGRCLQIMGGKYSGDIADNKANGFGVCVWNCGSKYEGYWEDNKMQGIGKFIWPDKSYYEGEWEKNRMHGTGKHCWLDGSYYEGEWVDGKRHGKGKYLRQDGEGYEGDWADNKKHGWGVYTWESGSVYEGSWECNIRNGRGCFLKHDGSYYLGFWERNKLIEKVDKIDSIETFVGSEKARLIKNRIINFILKRRRIKYLVHFTRVENIKSILEYGIVPVIDHTNYSIKATINDKLRIDNYPSASSFSVEFPNYKLFYYYRSEKYCNTDWLVIRIKPEILTSKNNEVYFCQTNAANLANRNLGVSAEYFENMFSETIITKAGQRINRIDLGIPEKYSTDPQAEILIEGIISPEYFYSLSFENKGAIDKSNIDINNVSNKIKLEVGSALFKPRNDYDFWR